MFNNNSETKVNQKYEIKNILNIKMNNETNKSPSLF